MIVRLGVLDRLAPSQIMVCRTAGGLLALPLQLGLQVGDARLFAAVADYGLQTVSDLSALPLQIMVCRTVVLVWRVPSQIMVCRTVLTYWHCCRRLWSAGR